MSRICIDGFNLSLSRGSGIATYARNLTLAQRALGHETQVLYGPPRKPSRNNLLNEISLSDAASAKSKPRIQRWVDDSLAPFTGRRAVRIQPTGEVIHDTPAVDTGRADVAWACRDLFHGANRTFAASRRFTPIALGRSAPAADLMHWTAPLPLRTGRMANAYTIHDLVPLRLPSATLDNKRQFHALCKTLCARADHVVTVSEAARADIVRIFGIDPGRITSTGQAVHIPESLRAGPDEQAASAIEHIFSLGWRRYFLFFGAIEPKKNLARVIEAYLASGATDPLVIIGGQSWLAEGQTRLLYDDLIGAQVLADNVIRRADRIRRYDYLPFSTLVTLIRGAKATVFPSLHEGFGLPVLESMLLGTPVLTSNAGALPEVAGDAALMVDPYDVQAITRGIAALDRDEGLRADLTVRGRLQADRFSPERYQARVAELYGRLL